MVGFFHLADQGILHRGDNTTGEGEGDDERSRTRDRQQTRAGRSAPDPGEGLHRALPRAPSVLGGEVLLKSRS